MSTILLSVTTRGNNPMIDIGPNLANLLTFALAVVAVWVIVASANRKH